MSRHLILSKSQQKRTRLSRIHNDDEHGHTRPPEPTPHGNSQPQAMRKRAHIIAACPLYKREYNVLSLTAEGGSGEAYRIVFVHRTEE